MNAHQLIMKILASERYNIPYRPALAALTGSATAALLLQQIQYWWTIQDFNAFYKFNAPCQHKFYRPGDSWTEELGFSKSTFYTARRKIAVKKPEGVTMAEARYLTLQAPTRPVIFWTNAGRLTYYTIHAPAFLQLLETIYLNPVLEFTKIAIPELPKSRKSIYLNRESGFRITETTIDHPEDHQQQSNVAVVDGWDLTNDFTKEENAAFDDLLRWDVRPQAAAELVVANAHQLARIQSWIDHCQALINDGQIIHSPAGFIVAGLRSNEAAMILRQPYRYGGEP